MTLAGLRARPFAAPAEFAPGRRPRPLANLFLFSYLH